MLLYENRLFLVMLACLEWYTHQIMTSHSVVSDLETYFLNLHEIKRTDSNIIKQNKIVCFEISNKFVVLFFSKIKKKIIKECIKSF